MHFVWTPPLWFCLGSKWKIKRRPRDLSGHINPTSTWSSPYNPHRYYIVGLYGQKVLATHDILKSEVDKNLEILEIYPLIYRGTPGAQGCHMTCLMTSCSWSKAEATVPSIFSMSFLLLQLLTDQLTRFKNFQGHCKKKVWLLYQILLPK